ncbi:oligosaccharide flippase family protein [Balneola sp. MJW-20]|uniref:oligosaccharide flippase family protein n=1 Tax=Gracilimonas aurantiaca TaxID=3234185 RepID=UPI003465D72D
MFRSSDYLKNVTTLATGTTLAQGVSLITAPILYRIYDKDDYGTLALYIGIVAIIGVFSTMQYLQPILLEKEDEDAKKVMWLNRSINAVVTVVSLVLILFLGNNIATWLNNPLITPWLYLIPVSIFFSGQNKIFRVWANRKKKYKIMSFNTILTAILVPVVSISIGLLREGALGLFLGLIASQMIPALVLLIALTRNEDLGLNYFDFGFIKKKAKQYKNFPLYSLPSEFVNRLTNQLPVFMISIYVGPAVVGVYNLCIRMLGLPIQLLGNALGEVYKQKATEDYNKTGDYSSIFIKTLKATFFTSLIPVLILIFFASELFVFFFGQKWLEAGILAQFMAPLFMLRLINAPLSYGIFIHNKLHIDMIASVIFGVGSLLCFTLGFNYLDNYMHVLIIFTLFYCITYLIMIIYNYRLAIK